MADTKRPTSPGAEEILGLYFPVLDHGFVSLVDYMGTDECIERAARVSYGYGTRRQSLTLACSATCGATTTPRQANGRAQVPLLHAHVRGRQWVRHRTASINEYSGRYSLIPMLFYTPDPTQLQTQSARNNQGAVARRWRRCTRRGGATLGPDPTGGHRRVRVDDRGGGGARAGAYRPAAVHVHSVVLEIDCTTCCTS